MLKWAAKDEQYPEYGRIVSAVYQLEWERSEEKLQEGKLVKFMERLKKREYRM